MINNPTRKSFFCYAIFANQKDDEFWLGTILRSESFVLFLVIHKSLTLSFFLSFVRSLISMRKEEIRTIVFVHSFFLPFLFGFLFQLGAFFLPFLFGFLFQLRALMCVEVLWRVVFFLGKKKQTWDDGLMQDRQKRT